ncbi:two-component system response regulator DcuR [Brevibacillus ginsengisoli]|uniref:two-component system response regulator DcuR n=1 Tax=Brevibacillus ginsengisoli TaxID=363854 RepID=UPI003CE94CFE
MIKVLIVEDDPMVAELNKRYLEQVEEMQLCAVASNSEEAMEILSNQEIDLILLDIYMPGMDGLELLSMIRNLDKSVDVIVISAASDIASIKKALRYGVVDYLIKPFEFERFHAALTAYREDVYLMRSQEVLNQEELDKLLFYKETTPEQAELPKGLTRKTMEKVWNLIQTFADRQFTTEELANSLGISRVSMRKYLQFLNEIGMVEFEITYGSVGRPVYKHRFIQAKSELIKPYL